MSHDLDDALRSALRRHAEAAPTTVDTDAVRHRSRQLQRRRTLEVLGAGVVLVAVVLGLGALVGSLRHDASLPPATTESPAPGGSTLLAFTSSTDGNSPVHIVVRAGGADRTVETPAGGGVTLLGWYGPEHRTLVWAVGITGFREGTLYAVRVDASGRTTGRAEPLRIPGRANLAPGVALATAGGPIQMWTPDTPSDARSAASLVTIAPDLSSATSSPLPTGLVPITITANEIVLTSLDRGTVSIGRLSGSTVGALTSTSACSPRSAAQPNIDASVVAFGCPDGSVDRMTLAGGAVTHLGVLPEGTDPGGLLGLWWDPAGGLNASVTPTLNADYSVVHDYSWSGTAWVRSVEEGVLTRIYPTGSARVRLVKKNDLPGNIGRWIVESSPEVDLGQTNGSLVVAPSAS